MDKIKISVIIPIYKVENYLRECIESVLRQTYQNLEVILVDDGSPDSCPQICEEYARLDKRIEVIHKKNGGLSSARNEGFKHATGEYVLFLDSDDYWEKETAIQELVEKVEEQVDLVLFRYKKKLEETGKFIYPLPETEDTRGVEKDAKEKLLDYMMQNGYFIASACNKLVRRNFLEENKISFRKGVTSEDIEWCAQLLSRSKKIQYVNDCFYVYRTRKGSITTSMTEKNIIDLRDNIIRSIQIGKRELTKESNMYRIFMQYMAYQYATLILCAHNVKEKNMYSIVKEMKQYAEVMTYSKNKKVIMFRLIYKVGGFWVLYRIAGFYMKYLYERI